MVARVLILSICFLAASAYVAKASKTEPTLVRQALEGVPKQIGKWQGEPSGELSNKVISMLGVNDYLTRVYRSEGLPVAVYIGFYESQRQGSAIHSPINCLPGAGWSPIDRGILTIPLASGSGAGSGQKIDVNRIIIEKGSEKQVVLYWYQSHGRVVASEYWGKIYTVLDSMRLNRTDGALVRIISPVSEQRGPAAAQEAAVDFVQTIFPILSRYLPD